MLKFLVFALLVAAVVAFFALRQTPKRPPRDWRHGGDDGGRCRPPSISDIDAGRKPANDKPLPAASRNLPRRISGGDGGD
jgi:hypothetical protein